MKRVLVLAAAVAAAAGSGCANARYVQKGTDEGVVAIPSNSDSWPDYQRTKALDLIQAHVGPSYEIVNEQEVVTGHTTVNQQDTKREATINGTIPFLPAEKQQVTTTTTEVPQREWQIHYRKVAGVAARPPLPGAGLLPAGGPPPTTAAVPAGGMQPPAVGPSVVPAGGMLPPTNLGPPTR
ncbi:MAG: hypothetical protein U0871_21285 [Gemmataceae bacterium]